MRDDIRYGMYCFSYIYDTAAIFSWYCYMFLLVLTIDLVRGVSKKKIRYIVMTIALWCFTGRSRAFAFIAIYIMLLLSVPFISWANVVRMQFLIPNEKDRIYVTSIIVGAILNVFINYNLIPLYGAAGAAIGTICAEATVMLIQTVCSRTEIDVPAFIKKSVPFLAFGFIMFFGVRILANILNKGIISMLAQIFVGALVYVSLSGVYFIATKNPIVTQLARKLHIMK